MIAAFSASSPLVSVALIEREEVLASRQEVLRTGASGMLLLGLQECLDETGRRLSDVQFFAADTGPGSFIGTRVAVTLAKTLAFANDKLCLAANAFDLMDREMPVVIPNRRHEWFVRVPGQEVVLVRHVPDGTSPWSPEFPENFLAYGIESHDHYPHATRIRHLEIEPVIPNLLLPTYLVEPSISTPKVPYAGANP